MTGGPGPEELKAWETFLKAHATVVRTLEREMETDQGLPLTWYDVLVQLEQKGGRLRMRDLADSVLLSRSNITRLVDRMTTAGMVSREPCEEDRRGMYTVITPAGLEALHRARPGHQRGIGEHFARHLDKEEVRALHRALSRVLDAEAIG